MKSSDNQQSGSTRGFASLDADQKRNPSTPTQPKDPFYKASENEYKDPIPGRKIAKDGREEKSLKASVERISPDQGGHGRVIPGTVEDSNSEEAMKHVKNIIRDNKH